MDRRTFGLSIVGGIGAGHMIGPQQAAAAVAEESTGIQIKAAKTMWDLNPKDHIAAPHAMWFQQRDLDALAAFWEDVKPFYADLVPEMLRLPFASTPLNLYVRTPEKLKELPEPTGLQNLVDEIRLCHDESKTFNRIRAVVRAAERTFMTVAELPELPRVPAQGDTYVQDNRTVVVKPQRVATPQLVIDIDQLNCRNLALMLTMLYRGPCDEMQKLVLQAREYAKDAVGPPLTVAVGGREAVDVYVKREAFMISMIGYAVHFGTLLPADDGRPGIVYGNV